jgi:hypothetical protein
MSVEISGQEMAKVLRKAHEKAQVDMDNSYFETGEPLMVSWKRHAFAKGALVVVETAEKMAGLKWTGTDWEEIS